MTSLKTCGAGAAILSAVLLIGGCRQPRPGWIPPLEETSTRFLQSRIDEALRAARSARREVRIDPGRAEQDLDDVERALERMAKYYLPLLEARDRTCNAHRFFYSGETARARSEIEAVEDILDGIAAAGGTALEPAMKRPLDLLGEAKAAVLATSDDALEMIKSLAIDLNLMALKGGLELPEDWPAPVHARVT